MTDAKTRLYTEMLFEIEMKKKEAQKHKKTLLDYGYGDHHPIIQDSEVIIRECKKLREVIIQILQNGDIK